MQKNYNTTILKKYKILITGINGFIGKSISKLLLNEGYDVWGIDRSSSNKKIIKANLLDNSEIKEAKKKMPDFCIIIHAAALAHSKTLFDNESIFDDNVKMYQNVLNVFANINTHIILLSSVAVYGEANRNEEVKIKDKLRPSTFYGKSKIKCEKITINSFSNYDILRLTPVYDKKHLDDVFKRLLFPLIPSLRMVIKPSPLYSLCNINTVCIAVLKIIERGGQGLNIYNISDSVQYSQNEISNTLPNKLLVLPEIIFRPIYWITYFLPQKKGYAIRCLYWKIFKSNIYQNSSIQTDYFESNNGRLTLFQMINNHFRLS
jgi:nucleoside-diphosphate-sugar epimerase